MANYEILTGAAMMVRQTDNIRTIYKTDVPSIGQVEK